MLSLETARKLKDAGLRWEPQMGDFMYNNDIIDCLDFADMSFAAGYEDLTHQGDVGFIPRLNQLLTEIEKRKHDYRLQANQSSDIYLYKIRVWYGAGYSWDFIGRNPDEAAAQALLWILEQEGQADEF